MKITAILGSSRSNGNTETLLDHALKHAGNRNISVKKIILRDLRIAPCNGCMRCAKTGDCAIKDDMRFVYDGIQEADGIIWASPVYYWSITGLAKTALDRTFALNFPKLQQSGKIGGLLLTAGTRGCLNAANLFHMYYIYNHMFPVEYAWGDGADLERGKDSNAFHLALEMINQMISLNEKHPVYPENFDVPLHRLVIEKYST